MATAHGTIFISPDYRLLNPSTGFDQIDDVKALFYFLSNNVNTHLPKGITLDTSRIAVAGVSAGGYLVRLCALYAEPRPRAALSLYGMGGDWLSDHLVAVKTTPMRHFGYMVSQEVGMRLTKFDPVAEVPVMFDAATGKFTDKAGRADLTLWWWQNGEIIDHLTGEVGLSERLRALPAVDREAAIPAHLAGVFPQLHIDSSFPPTMFIHGKEDTVVPVAESQYTHEQLEKAGVHSELCIMVGAEHGLAIPSKGKPAPQAESLFKKGFEFLVKEMA
jgi:acetyl esterase/lipase